MQEKILNLNQEILPPPSDSPHIVSSTCHLYRHLQHFLGNSFEKITEDKDIFCFESQRFPCLSREIISLKMEETISLSKFVTGHQI